MQNLSFSADINAPRQRVWDVMLSDETYRDWSGVFGTGSHFEGGWDQGSDIEFVGDSETGKKSGMYSRIAENRLHEYVSIQHLGELREGEKHPWPNEGFENYTFTDNANGGTTLQVELVGLPDEFAGFMNEQWPQAVARIKALAEQQ